MIVGETKSNNILKDRLAKLDTIELEHGDHESFDDGMCAMDQVLILILDRANLQNKAD